MKKDKTKIIFTGGGTGGHTSAAVAIITALKESFHDSPLEILFIGSKKGIESTIIPGYDIPYRAIYTGKLRRYFDLKNFSDLLLKFPAGIVQSIIEIYKFKPHVIFSSGGFVSLPVVIAGWLLRIPIIIHEQTALAGLANKIEAFFADRIAVSYASSIRDFPASRTILTGNPVRKEILDGDAARGMIQFRFERELPVIYITGGVQGSHKINRTVGEILPALLEHCQIIHQSGDNEFKDFEWLKQKQHDLPDSLKKRYRVYKYIREELPDVFAMTSLMVSRAGAGTVNEAIALGIPCIFIPLPGAAGGEQLANAKLLEEVGAARIILEKNLAPHLLENEITSLIKDAVSLTEMLKKAKSLSKPDAAKILCNEIITLARWRSLQ